MTSPKMATPAGTELRRVDEPPDTLSRLLDVQAAGILLLAMSLDLMRPLPPDVERLRRAVEASAPGAIEATRRALREARTGG